MAFERVRSWRSGWSDGQATGRSISFTFRVRRSRGVTYSMRQTISTLPLALLPMMRLTRLLTLKVRASLLLLPPCERIRP
jgi:hypothetical protein